MCTLHGLTWFMVYGSLLQNVNAASLQASNARDDVAGAAMQSAPNPASAAAGADAPPLWPAEGGPCMLLATNAHSFSDAYYGVITCNILQD